MPRERSTALLQSAIHIGAAGLGAAVAGPLGCAFGGFAADAFGKATAAFLKDHFEKFGEEAAKKLLDAGADSLSGKLGKSAPDLALLYRESLRLSLAALRPQPSAGAGRTGSADPDLPNHDWFAHWNRCLQSGVPLDLEPLHPGHLKPAALEGLFRSALERLDAQGAAIEKKSQSIQLPIRPIPPALLAGLRSRLPEQFGTTFRALLVTDRFAQAWKEAELIFRDWLSDSVSGIKESLESLRELLGNDFLERYYEARKRGDTAELTIFALRQESSRQAAEIERLKQQVAARSSEPAEAELSRLLDSNDYDAALRLKSRQVEARAGEASKLPRDLYELGLIHDLRFEWSQALAAYRRAWQLEKKSEYGFAYAVFAQKLNRFHEAIPVYQALLDLAPDPGRRADTLNNLMLALSATRRFREAEKVIRQCIAIRRTLAKADPAPHLPELAGAFNNLGLVLYQTHRNRQAEAAYKRALSIRRKLAKANPGAYGPEIAETLLNLGLIFSPTQRVAEAEQAYEEALRHFGEIAPDRRLAYEPKFAATLNNLGTLYKDTERLEKAEKAYDAALEKYSALARSNSDAYLPHVASTRMNLANLYHTLHRRSKAEPAYDDAIRIYRSLSKPNRDAYLPGLAQALNNLGNLYRSTSLAPQARNAYRKALAIYSRLAKANPNAYLNELADARNNLGNLYVDQGKFDEGRRFLDKAIETYSKLEKIDSLVFRPALARTVNNLARLCYLSQKLEEATALASQAESILDPYWKAVPALHNDQMSRILLLHALIAETAGNQSAAAVAFARRALPLACDPAVREFVQKVIERLCAEPPS